MEIRSAFVGAASFDSLFEWPFAYYNDSACQQNKKVA